MRQLCLLLSLCLLPLTASAGKPAAESEVRQEWKTFKYYRGRIAKEVETRQDEAEREEKLRKLQNLPVAKDGMPLVLLNPDGSPRDGKKAKTEVAVEAVPTVTPTAENAAETAALLDTTSAIEAEKKRIEKEKKAKELEEQKAKLLGDTRDAKGQVIDEDPAEKEEDPKGKKKKKK